ncbi:hypothetical protein GE061_003316 [Apolygus lucorum]|uniref:Uncharacterized protein n=1 Tax=Apolygus lucorum TaxID=248454 RepID=A0A6A4JTV5_APOLU|nr:hypothetical protein GE061_003316 [Apolygus lucorum]
MFCGYKFLVQARAMKQIKVLPLNRIEESRMALKLDDLIGKKKEVAQVLDLSKATANNAEEFKKLMEKVPEFKIKPEKLKPEDIKIHDFTKKGRRKKKSKPPTVYQFADPLPDEMRSIRLEDLCPVNIQWNMLTTLRPKSKADTEYFSRSLHESHHPKPEPKAVSMDKERVRRLVELGKLEIATQEKEKKNPDASFMRKMKNRAGIQESREPLVETIGKKEPVEKRGRSLTKSRKKAKTRSKSKRKSTDRSNKPRARSSSKAKETGSGGEKKSRKSKSRSRSRSKSKGPAGDNVENKIPKKVKNRGSPLSKKKVKISLKMDG